MADRFTEVSRVSWFGRIGESIKGILVGGLLFIVAFPVLFWNEGRAVKTRKTLDEGAGVVVAAPVDRVDAANEGTLIHTSGMATTDEVLADTVFGVTANALRLLRHAEMFQWRESQSTTTKKNVGGSEERVTTYSYAKEWSEKPLDSSKFKEPAGHENPPALPYTSTELTAAKVKLGAYTLTRSQVGRISAFTQVPVPGDAALPPALAGKAKVHDGCFYIGADPVSPAVGDVRIRFEAVKPTEVSVISRQVKDSFEPYRAKAGGTIDMVSAGMHTPEAMFQEAQQSNVILTWVLRAAGFLGMWIGLALVFKPLSVLADVLPFLGSLVAAGTGVVSFLIAALLSLVTVAVAWIFYRPLLGTILLVVSAGIVWLLRARMKRAKAAAAAATPAAAPPATPAST